MSDNAGCAWMFAILIAGFLGFFWMASLNNANSAAHDVEVYRICVESGGEWDGLWKSCNREAAKP